MIAPHYKIRIVHGSRNTAETTGGTADEGPLEAL